MSIEPGSVRREVISDSPDLGYPCVLLKENKRDKNTSHTKMAPNKHEMVVELNIIAIRQDVKICEQFHYCIISFTDLSVTMILFCFVLFLKTTALPSCDFKKCF